MTTKHLFRPAVIISLFTLAGYVITVVTQAVIAAVFGARADMDAFFAATTLPQYVIAVVVNALAFAFIPVFTDYMAGGEEKEAWKVSSSVITLCLVVLGVVAGFGIIFARPLLRATTPGLSEETLRLAAQMAVVTWPVVVMTALINLLTAIYQVRGRFGWPAAVPAIGALTTLGLVALSARPLGVVGVAGAMTAGIAVQAILLWPILAGPGRYRFLLDWRHPGIRRAFGVFWPLALCGIVVRWTPIIDRYIASGLSEGVISHLGYASKLTGVVMSLISLGITAVIFPRMALDVSRSDIAGLRRTVSSGMRTMWFVTAPVIAIGIALAVPVVKTVFQRGEFSIADTRQVSCLVQIYLLAMAGGCLGNVTGRAFYALKDTRMLSAIGTLEALAYVIYMPLLARRLGAAGIALGYAIYLDFSLVWQVLLLRSKMENAPGGAVIKSFIRTLFAAALGALAASAVAFMTQNAWLELSLGTVAGLGVYCAVLIGSRSPEIMAIKNLRQVTS